MRQGVLGMPDMRHVANLSTKVAQAAPGRHSGRTLPRWQAVDCLWEAGLQPWGRQRVLFGAS